MKKKYTFDDWHNGNVNLIYELLIYSDGEKPITSSWDFFPQEDQIKINQLKEDIFNARLSEI